MSRDVHRCSHWLRPPQPPFFPRIWAHKMRGAIGQPGLTTSPCNPLILLFKKFTFAILFRDVLFSGRTPALARRRRCPLPATPSLVHPTKNRKYLNSSAIFPVFEILVRNTGGTKTKVATEKDPKESLSGSVCVSTNGG
jgi:hypothetical protein